MKLNSELGCHGMSRVARDRVIVAIRCSEDVVQGTSDSVAELFAMSDWRVSAGRDSITRAVTSGAILGAFEMGAGLDRVAHGILLGAIGGAEKLRAPLLYIIHQTSRGTINAVTGLDGDVGAAVKGLRDAAKQSAEARGFDQESAATAVIDGAKLSTFRFTESMSEKV